MRIIRTYGNRYVRMVEQTQYGNVEVVHKKSVCTACRIIRTYGGRRVHSMRYPMGLTQYHNSYQSLICWGLVASSTCMVLHEMQMSQEELKIMSWKGYSQLTRLHYSPTDVDLLSTQ